MILAEFRFRGIPWYPLEGCTLDPRGYFVPKWFTLAPPLCTSTRLKESTVIVHSSKDVLREFSTSILYGRPTFYQNHYPLNTQTNKQSNQETITCLSTRSRERRDHSDGLGLETCPNADAPRLQWSHICMLFWLLCRLASVQHSDYMVDW